ncbi:monocarboxylate transporter 12-B-like [Ixodes scapularis]|uniref:monocarboxylate transporter 12-B-like n=1 Tax=Ixodes scapularis TaxID=6945 RepID=UPI001A9FA2F1|nr:monocarboxylate transporter 12-B-like [Ixodes scapularis]
MAWMTVTFGGIQGLGIGVITSTYSILLALYFDKYRGLTSGMKFAGGSLGGLVFPQFLLYLKNEYAFRGTLLIFGGITMHLSAIGILVKEPPWTSLKKNDEGARNATEEGSPKIQKISADSEQLQQASTTPAEKQVKKHRPALRLLLNPMLCVVITLVVLTDFTGTAFVTTLVDYALDKGLSIEDAESLIMYGSCSQLIGRLFLPLMADRRCFRRSTLVMASFFIWGCSVIAMSYDTLRVHIILLCLSVYLVYGCLQPMRSVLMADYIGVQWISTCYGFSAFFLLPLTFCSPSITGFFRDFHGSYDGLYMLHGGIQLAASALFLAVVCVERRNTKAWTLSDTI